LYDRVIRALPLRTGVVVAVVLAACGSAQAQGTAAQNRPAAAGSPPAATEAPPPVAQDSTQASTEDATQTLAVAAQNPIAAMYSLPFQNNTFFGVGPNHNQAANVLNIQPVLPFTIGDWNIISRTITPLISLPSLAPGNLGDLVSRGFENNWVTTAGKNFFLILRLYGPEEAFFDNPEVWKVQQAASVRADC
jgi:hypothetical protein